MATLLRLATRPAVVMLAMVFAGSSARAQPGIELDRLEERAHPWLDEKLLMPRGERYEATVPDTLDLAERARVAVHGLTSFLDPQRHHSGFGHGMFAVRPPCLVHDGGQDQNWGKVMEAMVLARTMSGSEENLDRQKASLNGMLSYAWLKKDEPYPVPLARMLMALDAMNRCRPHPELRKLIAQYADWLTARIRVDTEAGQGFFGPPEQRWKPDNNDIPMGPLGFWLQVFTGGSVLRAMVRAGMADGPPPQPDYPKLLREYLLDARFWSPEPHAPTVVPSEHGQFLGHHHSYTQALLGLLYFAEQRRDARTLEFVRRGYEYLRTFGLARIGLFGEGCTTGDMTYLAVRLSQWGVGDYWEDVDQYTRNHLTELQILDTDRLEKLVQEKARPLVASELGDWAKGLDTQDVVRRCRGLFWSDATHPTRIPIRENCTPDRTCLQWVVCCSGNCSKALHEVWNGIVEDDPANGLARVNLLLNRASLALDVDSHLPYEGKVVLRVKQVRRIALRVPLWVDKRGVECVAASKPLRFSWLGSYMILPEVNAGQEITVRFAMTETTEYYMLAWPTDQFWLESTQPPMSWRGTKPTRYALTLRGNTLTDIRPRDNAAGFDMYADRSAKLFRAPAPTRRVTRFLPSRP